MVLIFPCTGICIPFRYHHIEPHYRIIVIAFGCTTLEIDKELPFQFLGEFPTPGNIVSGNLIPPVSLSALHSYRVPPQCNTPILATGHDRSI